jgi:AcrR family transcriptional regulator
MRYEKGRKDVTRRRIMKVATLRFKEQGLEGAGLKSIMADAGLTNGAFYSHFASKDALVRESVEVAFEGLQEDLVRVARQGGLEAVLRQYLSAEHRDNPGSGCPSAALLPELGRHSEDIRKSYTARFNAFVECIAEYLPATGPENKERVARALFGLAVGSLQLARAVSDQHLSTEIMEGAIQAGLQLVTSGNGGNPECLPPTEPDQHP